MNELTGKKKIMAKRKLVVVLLLTLATLLALHLVVMNKSFLRESFSIRIARNIIISEASTLSDTVTTRHEIEEQVQEDLTCHYPRLNAYDEEILPYIHHPRSFNCKRIQEDISFINHEGLVELNVTALEKTEQKYKIKILCFWKHISKGRGDKNKINETKHQYFVWTDTIRFSSSGILQIECYKGRRKANKKVYFNLHVQPQPLVTPLHPPSESELSVYLLFFESMSTARFWRHMVSLRTLLGQMSAFQFEGYSKIADNTYVNIVPLLTGLRANTGQKTMKDEFHRKYKKIDSYDNVDGFIWKDFSRKNYTTVFLENSPKMGAFSYNQKPGFKSEKPFDYFYRPYFIRQRKLARSSSKYCFGNRPATSGQLDLAQQIFEKYGKTQKLFAINFIVDPGHEEENDIERIDDMITKSFKSLFTHGKLNKTILFLLGDHGPRFGDVRVTSNGYFEERLTYSSVVLPDWFLKKFPSIATNLKSNRQRLTTSFDIYQTLKQVLNGDFKTSGLGEWKSRGISLFNEIPRNRTCDLAGIPKFYCPCYTYKNILKTSDIAISLANNIVKSINSMIPEQLLHSKCSKLELKDIVQASELMENGHDKNTRTIKLIVRTQPGGGLFERVAMRNMTSGEEHLREGVSRLNKYGRQGKCVEAKYEKFCFCKK